MTVVHQRRTTFSPGNFIVSFLLHGITVLWYSFPEEDYFSVSNFAKGPFPSQSLQTCIAVEQGRLPAPEEKYDVCCPSSFLSYLLMFMIAGCTYLRNRVVCNETQNQEKLGGFGVSFTKIRLRPVSSPLVPKLCNPFGVSFSPMLSEPEQIYGICTETRDGLNKHPGFFGRICIP